mmetsp:Transcript_7079/g.43668  ORF Transcript_7079/g.43668 Transcript_7079/m.43668 type:complete len:89 (+) Transcript_7079:93-359(+)
MGGPHLRFCPTSNDLLYPKEDRTRKRLVYTCKTCGYQEDAESGCVYRNEFSHTEAEKTVVLLVRRTRARNRANGTKDVHRAGKNRSRC